MASSTFGELRIGDRFLFCADVSHLGDRARVFVKVSARSYRCVQGTPFDTYDATPGALVRLHDLAPSTKGGAR